MDRTDHTPLIVHSRADIARVLVSRRHELGETCEALDYRAGFSDRYVTKMENGGKLDADGKPSRNVKQGFHITPMAEVWLEALGFNLILATVEQAKAWGAVRAPVVAV